MMGLSPHGVTPAVLHSTTPAAFCAGMATHLEPADQARMLALFQAFSRLDGRDIGDCTLEFSADHQVRRKPILSYLAGNSIPAARMHAGGVPAR